MKSRSYSENAQRAQRLFTLSETKIEASGKLTGLKFSRVFQLSELSPQFQSSITMRPDLMRRCLFLAAASFVIGFSIGRMDFAYAYLATWLSLLVTARFLWMAFHWLRNKEEVEIFRSKDGTEAFAIHNDRIGDPEFRDFVEALKSTIVTASVNEPN